MKQRKKIIDACKTTVIYAALYLVSLIVLIGLFHTALFKNINVLMYRGTIFVLIAGILPTVLMWLLKKYGRTVCLSVKDFFMVYCICCCVNMVLLTLIPVTVERSISVFMLSYMEENEGKRCTKEEIEDVFSLKYMQDYGAFEKRLNEQLVSGNVAEYQDGSFAITDRGKFIVELFRISAELFDTDRRLVYPEKY